MAQVCRPVRRLCRQLLLSVSRLKCLDLLRRLPEEQWIRQQDDPPGSTVGDYSTTTGSIGLQIGAQSKAIIVLLMITDALDRFRSSEGWSSGDDVSVAVLTVGANGNVDTGTATVPIEAFVLTNSGLRAGVTLEGTKVTKPTAL